MRSRGGALAVIVVIVVYLFSANKDWRDAVASSATSIVRPILIPLVEIILEPAFVYTSAVAMLVAGIISCGIFWFGAARPAIVKFRSLRAAVTSLPMPSKQNHDDRFDAMQQLGHLFRREGMFLSAWALFQAQFIQSRRISEQPFTYFAAEEPIDSSIEYRGLMAALPGYFTSVGLILTFIGLVVALYFAAKGFRSGDLEQAREAILQLLNASAFKFITSVAALGTALFISVFYRFCLSLAKSEKGKTMATIEEYISLWRDMEIQTLGAIWKPDDEISSKIDTLSGAISSLQAEIANLSSMLTSFRDKRD